MKAYNSYPQKITNFSLSYFLLIFQVWPIISNITNEVSNYYKNNKSKTLLREKENLQILIIFVIDILKKLNILSVSFYNSCYLSAY